MTAAPADTPPTTNPEPAHAPALSATPKQSAISMTANKANEEQRQTANALRRAHAQLGAVITAVQAETDCTTLITQLSAVQTALNKVPGALSLEEIRKLFLTLT